MSRMEQQEMKSRSQPAPPSLDSLAAIFQTPPADPMPAQIWRSAWDWSVQLILLTEVRDSDIEAVPLSPEVEFADNETVLVDPSGPLTHRLGAWCGLKRKLPIRVLDVTVGSIGADDLDAVGRGIGEGAPITSVLDERGQVREAMSTRMGALAEAMWAPTSADPIDLVERFRQRSLRPSQVAQELGISPGDVTDLIRGDRAPSPEQAETLAPLLDVAPEALLSVEVDPDLVWALDRPRFRRRLAERGLLEDESDEGAWRLEVAKNRLPIAARTTGSTNARTRWVGLVETYLDEG